MKEKIGASKRAKVGYMKKLQHILNKLRTETFCSIHACSIFTWFEIRNTGDLTLLLKDKMVEVPVKGNPHLTNIEARKITPAEHRCLRIIYKQMLEQYTLIKGLTEEELRFQELTNEIIECVQKRIVDNDDSQWTWINIAKEKLDALTQSSNKSDLFRLKVSLEKIVGTPIDVYKCTVAEFLGYLKFAEDQESDGE